VGLSICPQPFRSFLGSTVVCVSSPVEALSVMPRFRTLFLKRGCFPNPADYGDCQPLLESPLPGGNPFLKGKAVTPLPPVSQSVTPPEGASVSLPREGGIKPTLRPKRGLFQTPWNRRLTAVCEFLKGWAFPH